MVLVPKGDATPRSIGDRCSASDGSDTVFDGSDTENNIRSMGREFEEISDVADEDDRRSDETESVGSASEVEDAIPFRVPSVATLRVAFGPLKLVDLVEEFQTRACVMTNVPRFLRGPFGSP